MLNSMFSAKFLKFTKGVLVLSGMIIGVGMFAIPQAFAKSGFWLGALELFLLTIVMIFFHLIYGEIVLYTDEKHRMPGYINLYLGTKAGLFARFLSFFSISCALLVYVLMGSKFLYNIVAFFVKPDANLGLTNFPWEIFLIALVAIILLFPSKKETIVDSVLTAALVLLIIGLVVFLASYIQVKNLSGINWSYYIEPYGVLLFALSGSVVIPDMITVLGKNKTAVRSAITIGTLIPAVLYFGFALVMVGVVGSNVGSEAISSLGVVIGRNTMLLGSLIGFLAILTSYISLGKSFQELMRLDMKIPNILAWVLVSGVPLFLYLVGFQNFSAIIRFMGVIIVGIDVALIIICYYSVKRKYTHTIPWYVYVGGTIIFTVVVVGIIYEISTFKF